MSELMNTSNKRARLRHCLLASVSWVMMWSLPVQAHADATDDDRPTVWVELGGQLERVDGGTPLFAAPFASSITNAGFTPISKIQQQPRYSEGLEGSISFQPAASGWLFSAAILYGRSNRSAFSHEQLPKHVTHFTVFGVLHLTKTAYHPSYSNGGTKQDESHAIVDFQAGKDVGLGLFGKDGTSVISGGIRLAQFDAKAAVRLTARPDDKFQIGSFYFGGGNYIPIPIERYHVFNGDAQASRSFQGIGPSVSWNVSQPFAGSTDTAEFTFDWGANAAMLFGRQKASVHHHTTGTYHHYLGHKEGYANVQYQHGAAPNRSRSVIVPNVGGFAGMSLKFPNGKVSLGYRADFFFGAMDDGIDAAKKGNRGFYGPFATISVGIGG